MSQAKLEPLDYTSQRTSRLGFRWWICALLFFATTLSYVDRGVISYIKGDLQSTFGWNEIDYGNVVASFSLAYAFGYLFAGRIIDMIGIRIGFALAVGLWSLAAMAHALNGLLSPHTTLGALLHISSLPIGKGLLLIPASLAGFTVARFALGIAEGGNFPAAVKTVGEWFPIRERALATGIFNAGSNIGALVTPILVPAILTIGFGWPTCFIVTGTFGLIWLIAWLAIYRAPERHPRLSPQELRLIRSDPPDPPARVRWLDLIRYRATWAFVVGVALSSPIWWFYLYWLPDFLKKNFGLDASHHLALPILAVYVLSDVGSVAGGWLSSTLIARGFSVNFGRKTALLACAFCVLPVFLAPRQTSMWPATLLIALAAAAHQGFSANLFTLVSDTMPKAAISSVVGIGGFAGALMGMLFQTFAGHVLQNHPASSYLILFGIASVSYLVAVIAIQCLVPRLERVRLPEPVK